MPAPIVWGLIALGGVWGFGYAAKETGEAADNLTKLTRAAAVAGGVYVSYRALKSAGAI